MAAAAPDVWIGVLSRGAPDYLENLLLNLRGVPPSARLDVGVALLDQASSPATRAVIARHCGGLPHARVRPLFLPQDVGFATGHALLFDLLWSEGRHPFHVALNQDVLFGEDHWLDRLIAPFADPRVGLAWAGPAVTALRTADVARLGLFDSALEAAGREQADLRRRWLRAGCRAAPVDLAFVARYLDPPEPAPPPDRPDGDGPLDAAAIPALYPGVWFPPAPGDG